MTQTAAEQGLEVSVEKVTDVETIMGYDVMATPAVVMNDTVVHSGGIPKVETILDWLKA
ncbi:thioredoxin family protein [Vibrio sp. PP-XX7]